MIKQNLGIKKIIPPFSRRGYKINIKERDNWLDISYKTHIRSVYLSLKRYITLDYNFFEGLGLLVGDGLNNPSIRNTHFNFANTDINLANKVHNWIKLFGIESIEFYLIIPISYNKNKAIDDILKRMNLNRENLKTYVKDRTKQPRIMIQVSNAIFQLIYLNLFVNFKKLILNNKQFRIAFLSGLFAAEGHVKHSVYGTPESISFAFNSVTEKELAKFVKLCLLREKIDTTIKSEEKRKQGVIYFTDYNNMLRFYLLGCMNTSNKKKQKFLELLKHTKVDLHFKKECLDFLKNGQTNTAKILNCSQAGISNMLTRQSMKIEYIKKLGKIQDLTNLKNINYATISNCYIKNMNMIKFLIDTNTKAVI